MDITTSNRIYDEIAMTIGLRLSELGQILDAGKIDILSTDVERDAGVDMACALGRLVIDSDDVASMDRAMAAQQDRIRSAMASSVSQDTDLAEMQRHDISEAMLRSHLLKAYRRNDRSSMHNCYEGLMAVHANRR